MNFVNLWAIGIGAVAVAAPIVVHWLTKPRPVRMPLSTLRFVREAIRQRRAAHLLRDVLILSLRMLAVALLALAVARPLLGAAAAAAERLAGETLRIVLVDVQSEHGGDRRRDAADRPGAGPWPPTSTCSTRRAYGPTWCWPARRPARCLTDRRPTSRRSVTSFPTARPCPNGWTSRPPWNAPDRCSRRRQRPDKRRRELVIFSDFQRSSWSKADFSAVPAETVIKLESTAPRGSLPNLAILRAVARADQARTGQRAGGGRGGQLHSRGAEDDRRRFPGRHPSPAGRNLRCRTAVDAGRRPGTCRQRLAVGPGGACRRGGRRRCPGR